MASVFVDILAEFTGKKAFKQAETATEKLSKTVGKLAKTFGVTFGAAAMLSYGKNAVKAFAENEKSAKRLETVLKNLGLSFDTDIIEKNLGDLSAKFGYEGEVLREAFQKLITVTGSTTKAQDLLNLSLDVAAGSGEDLLTVNQDLAALYVGNTKGLRKYNLGLSQSELKTLDFNTAVKLLTKTFAGAGAAELETYSGKMRVLKEAADNAQEIIGTGLVDAISKLGNDDSVSNLAESMESVALYTADVIRGIGVLAEKLKGLPGAGAIDIGMIPILGTYLEALRAAGKADAVKPKPFTTPMTISGSTDSAVKAEAARKAAEAAAKKRAAELLAMQKKTLKSQQDLLKINKAKAIFDIQKIQIEAALKGKISEEERIRLMLLKAIAEENIEDIEKYTKLLNQVQGKVTDLQSTLAEVYAMDAGNPFVSWEIGLDGVQRALIEINGQSIALTSTIAQNSLAMGLLGGASFAQALSGSRYAARAAAEFGSTATIGGLPSGVAGETTTGGDTNVTVIVQGTVTTEAELKQSIVDAVNQSGLTGNQLITGTPDRQVAI
jgi:hypothetical protein